MGINQRGNKKETQEKMPIKEIINKPDILSRYHTGSRLIQKKYEECSLEEQEYLIN